MYQGKTPGAIDRLGGHAGGAAPDAETLTEFGTTAYYEKCLALWADAAVPDEALMPNSGFLASWHVTDQRPRNVCVGFAAAAAVEALRFWQRGGGIEPVSPQFIYWMMRREYALPTGNQPPGYAIGATRLEQAKKVVERTGVVPDRLAPYYLGLTNRKTAPEGTAPSDEARAVANSAEFDPGDYGFHPVGNRPVQSLTRLFHSILKAGRPVVAGFPMFRTRSGRSNWHTVDALSRGEVLGPFEAGSNILEGALAESGHVVCLIGYSPDNEAKGEGWFVFRNSWGVDFGHAGNRRFPELPPGYGTISAAHVDHYCWEYYAPKLSEPAVA